MCGPCLPHCALYGMSSIIVWSFIVLHTQTYAEEKSSAIYASLWTGSLFQAWCVPFFLLESSLQCPNRVITIIGQTEISLLYKKNAICFHSSWLSVSCQIFLNLNSRKVFGAPLNKTLL